MPPIDAALDAQASAAPASGAGPRSRALIILCVVVAIACGTEYAVVVPARNYLLDYRAYCAAGRALELGINPYDRPAVAVAVDLPGNQPIAPYLYPPPTLGLAWLLAQLPYPAGQVIWAALQYACALAAVCLVLRALGCRLDSPVAAFVTVGFLLSAATAEIFRWGQFDMLVLVALAGAVLALQRNRPGWAGVLLGLGAVAKVTPAVYLGVLLIRRQYRGVLTGVATIVTALAASALFLPGGTFAAWRENLARLATETCTDNYSLHGFCLAIFAQISEKGSVTQPWLELGPRVASWAGRGAGALLGLVTLVWLLRCRRRLTTAESLAASIPLLLLLAPATKLHHNVQLLIPVAWMTLHATNRSWLDQAWVACAWLMCLLAPVQRFGLELPDALEHLVKPTATYACLGVWAYFVLRWLPSTQYAPASVRKRELRLGEADPAPERIPNILFRRREGRLAGP